jgi:hypothetical protein
LNIVWWIIKTCARFGWWDLSETINVQLIYHPT